MKKHDIIVICEATSLVLAVVFSILGMVFVSFIPLACFMILDFLWFNWKRRKFEEERRRENKERWRNYYHQVPSSHPGTLEKAYNFFGLEYESKDKNAIKKKYRELAMKVHPDHGGSKEEFELLQKYKDVLFKFVEI